jgi:thymidylate synthase (FAD)
MASINEYSARYSAVPDACAIPKVTDIRTQSYVNKQGSDLLDFPGNEASAFVDEMKLLYKQAYGAYTEALNAGVAREQARMILPQNMYTEFYWKIDLHNLLNFLKLRMDSHAQKEIQDFAKACHSLIAPLVPVTMQAFEDYVLNAVTLSKVDIACLKELLNNSEASEKSNKAISLLSKTEAAEFEEKLRVLQSGLVKRFLLAREKQP